MFKRLAIASLGSLLLLGLAGAGLVAGQGLDGSLGRYPGALRVGNETFDLREFERGAIQLQSEYHMPDAQPVVQRWYAAQLNISPAADGYVTGGGGCGWLTQSDQIVHLRHEVSVLVCAVPDGTRVVVNQSLTLTP